MHSGLRRARERLSEISFLKYQPFKPQWHVLHSTLHYFTWHNHWSNNGRQVKALVWGKVTLENLFMEQLMSNKQLLNEDGLSHWDRWNRLYFGGSLWLTKLWSKSKSWEVVPPVDSSYERCSLKTGSEEGPEQPGRLEWLLQLSWLLIFIYLQF